MTELQSNNQKRWARLSISSALPTAKERRSSNEVTSNYIKDFLPDVMLFPPAFSIRNPTAAASYNARSLHLCDFDPMLLSTPFPLMKIWPTSGTKPPVYLRVQPFLIQAFTTLSYYQFQFTARRLPGLNILDFSLIVRCQCETIHSFSIRVSSCTIFFSVLQMRAVVLGPQMVITALTCSPNLAPIRLLGRVFQIEKILPIAKFVSMMELPSSGSQVTTNPSPSEIE